MSKFLTVVFNVEDWSPDQLAGLSYNPDVKMISWMDVIQERDYFKNLCENNGLIKNDHISNQNHFYENQTSLDL